MVVFFKIFKELNEIQLTKKMDLNNWKIKNHRPSPDATSCNIGWITKVT